MTGTEYLGHLEKALKGKVDDLADIISEYEQHFARKKADGYTEEEIAARLEKPEVLARQFAQDGRGSRGPARIMAGMGLALLAPFALAFHVALVAWVLVIGAASLLFLATGTCLVARLDPLGFIPSMPFAGSALLGLSFLALALLCAIGTAYSWLFVRQLGKASCRWARNRISSRVLPALPINPELGPVIRRRLRGVALVAFASLGVSFMTACATMAIQAGSLGFWHVWHWFG